MAITGTLTRRRTSAIRPIDGVSPPRTSAAFNSSRSAPPATAVSASSPDATQTSSRMRFGTVRRPSRRRCRLDFAYRFGYTGTADRSHSLMRNSLLFALLLASPAALAAPPAKYAAAVTALEGLIERERLDASIPGMSVALVEDQTVVWAKGFGHADRAHTRLAAPETVYRVGSVSKLFTDLAVMQLVDEGKLDLDAPVARYLPEFRPDNRSGVPITLRHLMAHRSGLIREPPVGNYFDPDVSSLD